MDNPASQDEQFTFRLKSHNERLTTPRLHIFRMMRQHSPLSMRSLRQKAKTSGIDSVTVYRTIDLLKRLNLVQEIGVGNRRMLELTDDFGGHHHHLWCTSCGKMRDFDDPVLEATMTAAALRLGAKIESHQVEIVGLCSACLEQARSIT